MESHDGSAIAARLASFVVALSPATLPPDVVEKAKCCLLYGLGIGLCSFPTPFAPVAARAAVGIDGEIASGATILWSGRKTSVGAAALANAALLHGRCQEDTCGTAHIGAVIIPLLVGLLEARAIPVDRLLPALIAGYEVGGALEATLAKKTMAAGFRASPLYGAIAAAAAAAKLLDLSEAQTRSALAHAVAFDGGTLQPIVEGTDEWRYQVGFSAQAGLVAVELARAGAVGATRAFEGEQGFAQAFAHTAIDASFLDRLGIDWSLHRVTFKPFPVCAHNQSTVAATLRMRDRIQGREIQRIDIHIDPYLVPGMECRGPFVRVAETLLSTHFCVAAAIARGKLDMDELESFDDPAIAALIPKTFIVTDAAVQFPACTLRVQLGSGEILVHEERVTFRDFDLTRGQISDQLKRIGAGTGVPTDAIAEIETFVDKLPRRTIADIVKAFALVRQNQTKIADMPTPSIKVA
jgi:2-methylcitrate dehydratase PrpD